MADKGGTMALFGSRRARSMIGFGAALAGCIAMSGCGSDSGPPTLTWYINPDNGGQATRAQECADASGGTYRVDIEVLPSDATSQREQLVRRLAAKDSSIDAMSLDVVYTAEFANAGFLRPYTPEETAKITAGMLPAPIETGKWKDVMYAAPIKSNTQLLWYRKSLAQQAGVDPNSPTFTWDDMQKAADSQGKKISEQGARYEGYMVWINALVLSGGGQILTNAEEGKDATPTMAGPAGDKAAQIVGTLGRSQAAPSNLTVAQEEQGRAVFQGDQGMFMLNWPYVYAAARSAVEEGTLSQAVVDDIGWARFPRVFADRPSMPPLGGANFAIGAYSKYPDLTAQLAACVTTVDKATQYMLDEGEPSPYASSYDDPKVREQYPNADLIRESIAQAGPRPITPYYVDVAGSVINTWHPANSVGSGTPAETDTFMGEVLSGKRLL
jgi:multiple sugar transport system substrate-binding protein